MDDFISWLRAVSHCQVIHRLTSCIACFPLCRSSAVYVNDFYDLYREVLIFRYSNLSNHNYILCRQAASSASSDGVIYLLTTIPTKALWLWESQQNTTLLLLLELVWIHINIIIIHHFHFHYHYHYELWCQKIRCCGYYSFVNWWNWLKP